MNTISIMLDFCRRRWWLLVLTIVFEYVSADELFYPAIMLSFFVYIYETVIGPRRAYALLPVSANERGLAWWLKLVGLPLFVGFFILTKSTLFHVIAPAQSLVSLLWLFAAMGIVAWLLLFTSFSSGFFGPQAWFAECRLGRYARNRGREEGA